MNHARTVLFTQPLASGEGLAERLRGAGWQVVRFPMIETRGSALSTNEIRLLHALNSFDWLIFTSKSGVRFFFEQLARLQIGMPIGKTAVIGAKTQVELRKFGLEADYVNSGTTSQQFAPELIAGVIEENSKVLLLLGNLAPTFLQDTLQSYCTVARVNIYETTPCMVDTQELRLAVRDLSFGAIVFTSPSGVEQTCSLLQTDWQQVNNKAVCIGRVTAKALRKTGITSFRIAEKPTEDSLFESIQHLLV